MIKLLCLVFWFGTLEGAVGETIIEAISRYDHLNIFRSYLKNIRWVEDFLSTEGVTLFAPTDEAFDRFVPRNVTKLLTSQFMQRHLAYVVLERLQFPSRVSSLSGFPQLWLTLVNDTELSKVAQYFVQDAKILNIANGTTKYLSTRNRFQRLYLIDRVLQTFSDKQFSAWDLLQNPKQFGIDVNLSGFKEKVSKYGIVELFKHGEGSTFFIPVGDKGQRLFEKINNTVIEGHVISNEVLFIRTMGNRMYNSSVATGNGIEIHLSLEGTLTAENRSDVFMTSRVILNPNFPSSLNFPHRGVIVSKLLTSLSDVPVSNGVVHFIESPLIILNTTVLEHLENRLQLFGTFFDLVKKAGIAQKLNSESPKITVFVPTNKAFDSVPEKIRKSFAFDKENLIKLLYLHILPAELSTEDLAVGRETEVKTIDGIRTIYLRISQSNSHKELTVEGGGINSSAIETDIAANNGIIHIIDRVMGLPYENLYHVITEDNRFNITSNIGMKSGWNKLLKSDTNATCFVPENKAWSRLKNRHPLSYSAIICEKTSEKVFSSFCIKDYAIPYDQIVTKVPSALEILEENNISVYTSREGRLRISLQWNGAALEPKYINVVRPDMMATNGIIHAINEVPLMLCNSVLDLLRHINDLSITYEITKKSIWNEGFQKDGEVYTYFTPTNDAWNGIKKLYPELYDGLINGRHAKLIDQVLGRMITKGKWTLHRLLLTFELETNQTVVEINKYDHVNKIYIKWRDIRIEILEYNIEGTNGMLHIVDKVFLSTSDDDDTANFGRSSSGNHIICSSSVIFRSVLLKFLYFRYFSY